MTPDEHNCLRDVGGWLVLIRRMKWTAAMAKGQLCPKCGRYTLQYDTKNWLKCSNCETKVKVT